MYSISLWLCVPLHKVSGVRLTVDSDLPIGVNVSVDDSSPAVTRVTHVVTWVCPKSGPIVAGIFHFLDSTITTITTTLPVVIGSNRPNLQDH